ncbi:hypothetical protein, partial [Sphaerisporangium flaviroseum]|uniref:hypothetical protein n=1 Tax=Sphaerisporangium flaviroseum TaxID=509199 RepID=UPI0031E70F23
PTGGIAAVSRIPGSMELWWPGREGSVEGAYWYEAAPVPSIDVRTEKHQLGGWIHVSGHGFTPNSSVELFADGLVRRERPMQIGSVGTAADGAFKDFVYDARCWSGQFERATVRAVDVRTGARATGTTTAFSCG